MTTACCANAVTGTEIGVPTGPRTNAQTQVRKGGLLFQVIVFSAHELSGTSASALVMGSLIVFGTSRNVAAEDRSGDRRQIERQNTLREYKLVPAVFTASVAALPKFVGL